MPSRNKTFECICRLCTEKSLPDSEGKIKGKLIPLSQKAAHLARLTAADEALRQAALVDAATEAFKSLSLIDVPLTSASPTSGQRRPVDYTRPPKAERSKLTQTAHAILNVVEQRVEACLLKIKQAPTLPTLDFAEDELIRLQVLFDNVKRPVASILSRKTSLAEKLAKLEDSIADLKPLHSSSARPLQYDSGHHFDFSLDSYHPVAQITMFIVVVGFVMMSLSRRLSELLLGLLSIAVSWVFNSISRDMTALPRFVLEQIPRTLETVLSRFKLEGKTTTYAVCPTCHCIYAPTFLAGTAVPTYPDICQNQRSPNSPPCNTPLLSDQVPQKTFVYPHFHDYVAGLLARKDLEDMIDSACDDLMDSIKRGDDIHHTSDAFQAEFIRNFKGPDQTRLFVHRPGTEARLLFAFNFDFFAVEGMKLRGASASCGIFSAACLNLPLSIRYKPEYMYIFILPGPDEPHLTEVNHYIRPIVDDLLVSWERGVQYSQTANYTTGRMSRSAAILGVCDLPAARKISQLAGHSSNHFCSRCSCYHQSNLHRTDIDSFDWLPKDRKEVLSQAEKWKAASSATEQEKIFKRFGVRWSELWRLPYWEPSRTLAVDIMHCGFEGCAQHQFRDVLGLSQDKAEAKSDVVPSFEFPFKFPDEHHIIKEGLDDNDLKDIAAIHSLLVLPRQSLDDGDDLESNITQLTTSLSRKRKKALAFVTGDVGATPALPPVFTSRRITKDHYAVGLANWRRQFPLFPMSNEPRFATIQVMNRIREVIRDTDTPSWISSVPYNFGHAAAGSLKADEWRTMAMIYLPIALVSMWGEGTTHPTPDITLKLRQVLDHTMDLVSALSLASMRTMTDRRMSAYLRYITSWVRRLPELHPGVNGRVNNHMAIHIYDFLHLFGPVRSWWCFPFERLVGQLQRLPTNHKFGELEVTILTSFIRTGRLKRWLSHPDRPPIIKECEVVFEKAFSISSGDVSVDDSLPTTNFQPTPVPLRRLLPQARQVALRARHRFDGVFFSRASTHVGNSLVLFYPEGDISAEALPASIDSIILLEGGEVVYAVRRQLPAISVAIDPFQPYPDFPAKIYSPSLSSDLEIIRPEWIFSHYARWKLDRNRAVVLALSRD